MVARIFLVLSLSLSPLMTQSEVTDDQHEQTQNSALISSLLKLVESRDESSNEQWQYQFPRDHQAHPAQAVESWQVLSALTTGAGSTLAVSAQILRVGLNVPNSARRSHSLWSFDHLFGLSLRLADFSNDKKWSISQLARPALNLAGSNVATMRTWVNQHTLQLQTKGECALVAELSMPIEESPISLALSTQSCPLFEDSSSLIHGYSLPFQLITGQVGQEAIISGKAWLLRNWGELPLSGSPVVLDQFTFLLDDALLQVTRSRRRDGSGEPVLSATMLSENSQQVLDYRTLSLQDTQYRVSKLSAQQYSAGWLLSWPGYSARIEPLDVKPELAAQEQVGQERDFLGQMQWSGAVRMVLQPNDNTVEQTRELVGFADLSPLVTTIAR